MLPRIKRIIAVEPYKIVADWSTGEVRVIDFDSLLKEYQEKPNSLFHQLLNPNIFIKVKTDGRTLYWENLATMVDYNGCSIAASLDFCPDVLFEQSTLITS